VRSRDGDGGSLNGGGPPSATEAGGCPATEDAHRLPMANDQWTQSGGGWTDSAANAARRAAERRETGGSADVQPGGPGAPAEVTIPGQREQEARTPGREATPDVGVPSPEPEREIPGHTRGEPDTEIPAPLHGAAEDDEPEPRVSGPTAEEAPELLGERSDYPTLYGEDPGDIG
jgi:hypothetical protein